MGSLLYEYVSVMFSLVGRRHGLVMGSTTQEMLTNPGRLFEKLCRSPKTFEIALFSFDVAESAPYIYRYMMRHLLLSN